MACDAGVLRVDPGGDGTYVLSTTGMATAPARLTIQRVGEDLHVLPGGDEAGSVPLVVNGFFSEGGQLLGQDADGVQHVYAIAGQPGAALAGLAEGDRLQLALSAEDASAIALSPNRPAEAGVMPMGTDPAQLQHGRMLRGEGGNEPVATAASVVSAQGGLPQADGAGDVAVAAPATAAADTARPVIAAVMDDQGVLQGRIEPEGFTDDGYPEIIGTAVPGVLVHIYDGIELIGRVRVDESGEWSFTPRAPLIDGRHALSIAHECPNGDSSEFSDLYVINVDKTTPAVPVILGAIDDVGRLTGQIAPGSTIDDSRPTVSGTAEPHASVIVYDKGVEIGRVPVDAAGNWSFTPEPGLADGTHLLSHAAVDRAGNMSAQSEWLEFVVDTREERVAIHLADDDAGAVTGVVFNGGTTDDTTPTLQGTATAGGIVKIYEGLQLLGQVTAAVDGRWTFTPPTAWSEGAHTVHATVTLVAKGESERSDPFSLVVDSMAPDAPSIDAVHDDVGAVQGLVQPGQATDDNLPTLQGRAEANSTVRIHDNGVLLGTALADANGAWQFTPVAALADGEHRFTVTSQDAAGNTSAPSPAYVVLVDATAPVPPTIESAYDDVGIETGWLASGAQTDDARPLLTGSAEAHSTVIIKDDGVELGRVQADADGRWSFAPASDLGAGLHGFTAEAMDAAGNGSAPSNRFELGLHASGDDSTQLLGGRNRPLSVTFVADVSGSMGTTSMNEMKAALKTLIGTYAGLSAPVTFNLITFASAASDLGTYTFSSSSDPGYVQLMAKITGLTGSGSTSFESALTLAMKKISAEAAAADYDPYAAKQVFFLSDGGSKTSAATLSKWQALMSDPDGDASTDNPIVATTVGIGSGASYPTLNLIATSGTSIKATSPGSLTEAIVGGLFVDSAHGNLLDNDTLISSSHDPYLKQITFEGVTYRIGSLDELLVEGTPVGVKAAYDATTGRLSLETEVGRLSVYLHGSAGQRAGDYRYEVKGATALILQEKAVGVYGYIAADGRGATQQSTLTVEVATRNVVDGETVKIAAIGKDSGVAGDFVTADGTAGRMITGELNGTLGEGMSMQVSVDNGVTWQTVRAIAGNRWAVLDKTAHAGDWEVQVRLVDRYGTVGGLASKAVTWAPPPAAPGILRIDEAMGVLTTAEAKDGVDMMLSLVNTGAKAGDIVHINWGIGLYDQVLTTLDVVSGLVVVKVPAAVTGASGNGQGVAFDFDVTASIVANGVKGAASVPYHVTGGGFAVKALADSLSVAATLVVNNAYDGNGVTISAGNATLTKVAQTTTALAGLTVTGDMATARVMLDTSATKFQLTLSGLDNASGGALIIVYGVDGAEIHRESVTGTLSSGRYVKTYAFTAAEGVDVGSFEVISGSNSLTLSSFSQSQAVHVADSRDLHKVDDAMDTYYGHAGDEVITLATTAATYFSSTANKGIHGGDGVDTLKLAGSSYAMNLNLATSEGKLSGIEVIDLTGTGNNTLTLSLKDVLANGQADLFHVGDRHTVQMMVKGNAGDVVNLDDLLGSNGHDFGDWSSAGPVIIGGSVYVMYQHSGLDAELLVQDAVKVNLI